jgi:ABC-2 type transport system ATP-binding protein
MYVRLAFAVAVHVDPDILLVDEVLAVGDEPFQRKCMERIRGFQHEGRTIVLVSHGLDQVADLCDRAIVLEQGIVKADGPPLESLRVLRDDFENTRREDVERSQRSTTQDAPPPTKARVTAVSLTSHGVTSDRLSIKPGDEIVMRVRVHADEPLSEWILGVAINTPLGQSVFGTNTKLMSITLPRVNGEAEFQFRLPRVELGEGAYSVDAAISLKNGLEVHRLVEGARIVVEAAGRSVGFIHLEPEFSRL